MIKKIIYIILITLAGSSTTGIMGQCKKDLFFYIKNNDIRGVKSLCSTDYNSLDDDRYTPLMYAVQNKNIDLATYLISKNAKINYPENGYTPVMIAAENKDLEMLKLLNTHGADFKMVDSTNIVWGGAKTLLNYSITDGCYCEEVFNYLLEHGAIVEGTNILCYALYIRNMEHTQKLDLIKNLIGRGADLKVSGDSGYPLLDIANMLWDDKLYQLLIESGAEEEIMDNRPEEPIVLSDEGCSCSENLD